MEREGDLSRGSLRAGQEAVNEVYVEECIDIRESKNRDILTGQSTRKGAEAKVRKGVAP